MSYFNIETTSTPESFLIFSAPFNGVNSIINDAATTLPPAFLIKRQAAHAVPPVASSKIKLHDK